MKISKFLPRFAGTLRASVKVLLPHVIRSGSPSGSEERILLGAFFGGRAGTSWKVPGSGQDFEVQNAGLLELPQ